MGERGVKNSSACGRKRGRGWKEGRKEGTLNQQDTGTTTTTVRQLTSTIAALINKKLICTVCTGVDGDRALALAAGVVQQIAGDVEGDGTAALGRERQVLNERVVQAE